MKAKVSIKAYAPYIGLYGLLLFMSLNLFHYNQAEPYRRLLDRNGFRQSGFYNRLSYPLVKAGLVLGLATRWVMYSPSWKKTVWLEWQVQSDKSQWIKWDTPSFSPEYRSKRSLFQALIVDFKEAKINVELMFDDNFRNAYAQYLCREVWLSQRWVPSLVRVISMRKIILPPDKSWSPVDSPIDQQVELGKYRCLNAG